LELTAVKGKILQVCRNREIKARAKLAPKLTHLAPNLEKIKNQAGTSKPKRPNPLLAPPGRPQIEFWRHL